MSSQCTNDGTYNLTVTFKHGVDLNMAQVLVQNRVALAMPLLPDVIKQTGVTVRKKAPDILLVIAINSPDGRYDQLYLSNYALMQVKDELARLPGVSDVTMLGQRDYSMRIWVDPDKLAERNMTAGDVVAALREQNAQVATGQIGQPPVAARAADPGHAEHPRPARATSSSSSNVVVKATPDGRLTRLKDVARVELGAKNQDIIEQGQRQAVARAWRSSSSPTPTRWTPPTSSRRRWRSSRPSSPRASTTRSATTPRRSSASRSTRCSRRCARR